MRAYLHSLHVNSLELLKISLGSDTYIQLHTLKKENTQIIFLRNIYL